jgi:predicted nucleic acid-binding protein
MGLSCLIDPSALFVMDASVAINLSATGLAAEILRALPNKAAVTSVVMSELKEDRRTGRRDAEIILALAKAGLMVIAPLSDIQGQHFESLVIGRGVDTLDDGEAATVAYAVEAGAVALIDERKANRICEVRYPALRLGCSVDLLCHDAVAAAIDTARLANGIFSALQDARMRVLPQHVEWVIKLIGHERAARCPSLPRAARLNELVIDADVPK